MRAPACHVSRPPLRLSRLLPGYLTAYAPVRASEVDNLGLAVHIRFVGAIVRATYQSRIVSIERRLPWVRRPIDLSCMKHGALPTLHIPKLGSGLI
jgi:hypothetical protein